MKAGAAMPANWFSGLTRSTRLAGFFRLAPYLILVFGPLVPLAVASVAAPFSRGLSDAYSLRAATLLAKSLGLGVSVSLLAALIGAGTAFFLVSGGGAVRRVFRACYLFPLLIPAYVYAASWIALFDPGGLLARPLKLFGVSPSPYGFPGTAVSLALLYAPMVTLLVQWTLESFPRGAVEAARLAGGDARAWREVLLPLSLQPVLAGAGVILGLVLVDFSVPSLLQWNVYAMEIFSDFSQSGDAGRACWLSLPLVLVAAALVIFSQLRLRRTPFAADRQRGKPLGLPLPRGFLRAGSGACAVLLGLGATVPLAVLAAEALSGKALWAEAASAGPDFLRSLAVAVCAGLLAASCAWPAARILAGGRSPWLWSLVLLPLALPAPLFGIAVASLLRLWPLNMLQDGLAALALAHAGHFLPVAVLAAASQFRRVDTAPFDAARLTHVNPLKRLARLQAPMAAGALLSAFGITAAFSLGEVGATVLLVPPGMGTLTMRLFNLLHYGASDAVALLALLSALFVGLAASLALSSMKWSGT